MGASIFGEAVIFPVEGGWNNAYAQTPKGGSIETELNSRPEKNPPKKGASSGRRMRGEAMGGTLTEEMREGMKDLIHSKELPFYQEKTFLVMVTASLVLLLVWFIKQGGIRPWRVLKREGSFVQEAILVVDLCESTKLAVTQGDVFSMRIKKKMKACVREVSENFGATFFENTGDGYLIMFPTGTGAVRAAVKILQNADDYNKDAREKERIELRIGINYGELILDEHGGRHGAAINKVFRIEGLKKEQQQSLGDGLKPEDFMEKNRIFVSEEISEEIRHIKEIQVQPVGVFELKGFTGLHRIYYIPWEEVPHY
jgi:class 3 adenylate cyclase